jgi:amino acid adenylation domain-containing protein
LLRRGVGRESLVGVSLPRSLESIIVMLGIMQAGAIYVPLDASGPLARSLKIVEVSGMQFMVANEGLSTTWPAAITAIPYSSFESEIPSQLKTGTLGAQAAYVIFTSGSTGEPKGVVVSHESLRSHCLEMKSRYRLQARDSVLQMASLTFDASLEQIFPTLLSGSTLVLRGPDLWSMQDISYAIIDHAITVAEFPPALLLQWLENIANGKDRYPLLRLVIVGGDLLSPGVLSAWRAFGFRGEVRLVNTYGPTECTITATMCDVLPNPVQVVPEITIGTPISRSKVYVLGPDAELVPVGTAGELFISGSGVARGYLHQPGWTAERFLPDPFSTQPGGRMYRTGDLARHLPDGRIEFLGRADNQVKIRGFRIELGEIEAALRAHPQVDQAVVTVRELQNDSPQLICHWTSRGDAPGSETLRDWCRGQLPNYMVPACFLHVPHFELTGNGKVDRSRLPDIKPDEPNKSLHWGNNAERGIGEIWQELLSGSSFGPEDNFFSVGGHSLLLIRLHAKLQSLLNREFPLMDLFRHSTIRAQARLLTSGSDPISSNSLAEKVDDRAARQKAGFQRQRAAHQKAGASHE